MDPAKAERLGAIEDGAMPPEEAVASLEGLDPMTLTPLEPAERYQAPVVPVPAGAKAAHIRSRIAATLGDLAQLALDQAGDWRSEEHTSELQSLMRISYAVFCLKKKNDTIN